MKLFFVDLETTGVDREKHGIHQISGAIVIDGVIMEKFNFRVAPGPSAFIDNKALEVCGVTYEQIRNYPPMQDVFLAILYMIHLYVNIEDPKDKFTIVGYNALKFDSGHFAKWFQVNGQLKTFKLVFWLGSVLDVMIIATNYIGNNRHELENMKLVTVAKYLGITVDESMLHDAEYDIYLTYEIHRRCFGQF